MTRILHSGDPRGPDYRAAAEKVSDIRSRLSQIRRELNDLGKIEAMFPHDRLCDDVAGTMSLALIALYSLLDGRRSFEDRADTLDELWDDVAKNPKNYRIEDGQTWDWQTR